MNQRKTVLEARAENFSRADRATNLGDFRVASISASVRVALLRYIFASKFTNLPRNLLKSQIRNFPCIPILIGQHMFPDPFISPGNEIKYICSPEPQKFQHKCLSIPLPQYREASLWIFSIMILPWLFLVGFNRFYWKCLLFHHKPQVAEPF